MSDDKIHALQKLIITPKNLNKLIVYERNLQEANTLLLFDCRKAILNAQGSSKFIQEAQHYVLQIKTRIDTLIDRARYDILRFKPGISDDNRKMIADNCILFNFIIFSRTWDLKEDLKKLDSLIMFKEIEKLTILVKSIIENLQVIDELITNKGTIKNTVQSSEETASALLTRFGNELEMAEKAGALKGILTLEKPKILGKGKYYDQLGTIILKVVFSFGIEHSSDPISIRAITNRLHDEYPRVRAEPADVLKAIEILAENGFLYLNVDHNGVYWITLNPTDSEANIVLALAESKGYLTVEGLMLETGWPLEKATTELEQFVQAGIAVKDADYATGLKYYFPGFTEKSA